MTDLRLVKITKSGARLAEMQLKEQEGALKTLGNRKAKDGGSNRPPYIIMRLTIDEIVQLGIDYWNSREEDVIRQLGVIKPKGISSTMGNFRWRQNFDKGRAIAMNAFNKTTLAQSKDAVVQKRLADITLKPPEVIDDSYEWVITAPEWFKKGISKGSKIEKPRKKVEKT